MPDDGSNTLDAEAQMISSNAVSDGVSVIFFYMGIGFLYLYGFGISGIECMFENGQVLFRL